MQSKTFKITMMGRVKILFPSILFCVTASAFAGAPPPGDILPDLVEKVRDGVVNISSTRFVRYSLRGMPEFFGMFGVPETHVQKQSSLGSGFLIDKDGYILTNNHVIENADEVVVLLYDQRRLPAKIIGRDKALDLALLQLKGGRGVPNLKPLTIGSSEKLRQGQSVFAIGNPFGLQHTVSAGIISGKNRTVGIGPYDNFLQTDASINFGNSGGPLFNLAGEVVGINTAINPQGQLIGFAIPIDEAKENLPALKNYGYIARPWLGLYGENITPALQAYYELPVDHGVVIAELANRAPAVNAGLKVGDILLSIGATEIRERGDVKRALLKFKAGDSIEVKFNRRGANRSAKIKLDLSPKELPEGVL